MKVPLIAAVIVLAPRLVSSASLTSFCLTYYDSTSTTPVPTSTYSATTTTTRTVKSTSSPVTTVTPASATTTKTVTSTVKTTTTLSKVTGTYTSTTTFTSSAVTTSTSTTVVTNTAASTTTDTSPATATPSPDFIPLQDELRPGGYTNFACPSPSQFVARGLRDIFAREPNAELLPRQTSTSYPASVGCTTLFYATSTSTSVITASTTSTKSLKQGTITSTSTVTTSSTSTKVPSTVKLTVVSTTTTVTSTATAVSTSTTVTTTTTTAYQPASTIYPACQDNNIVQCVNGYQASNPHFVYNLFEISGATDPKSCCIACSQNQGCGGSMFYKSQGACYGIIDDVCEGNNSYASFQVQPGNYAPIVFSNSNCGRWGVRAPDS